MRTFVPATNIYLSVPIVFAIIQFSSATLYNQHSTMPIPIHTTDKPSTSETKEVSGAHTGVGESTQTANSSQQPKSEAELAAEKLYEERMEEEYAKREGGA